MTGTVAQAGQEEGGRSEPFGAEQADLELQALLEETDAALADCLDRLDRVRVSQVPLEVRSELIFLQGMLKAARVDLTVHYPPLGGRGLSPSSGRVD